MARITFDGQSFSLENRRLWLVGANLDYARIPPELWQDRITAVRQAGFNTVVTHCPWIVHEPRKGRYSFAGQGDIKQFVELCIQAGLYVGLKVGPYVGAGYDGGGLPSWLSEVEGIAMRESNQPFMERAGAYLRKLIAPLADYQAEKLRGQGGIIFMQVEQSWRCTKDDVADAYLGELAKHVRENGFNVPIFNANAFWAEGRNAIETWMGFDHLLTDLRQMRVLQSGAPRVVSSFIAVEPNVWGDPFEDARPADAILYNLAQVLAAGAQPIVHMFHGGTNFGFLSGRRMGRPDGFITTAPALSAPLGEAGARGRKYNAIKRIATFANHFGAVFAELDPDYQPVTVALDHIATGAGDRGVSTVPLRGAQGRVIFVFGDPLIDSQESTLLLDHGVPLSLNLGDQAVGWYLIDVDLGGRGWLDYANICPFALVDRSILVLFGPEGFDAQISINESMIEISVPSGQKPRVVEHQEITLVVCSEQQIDATYIDDKRIYVGVSGLDREGRPIAHGDFSQATIIERGGAITTEKLDPPPKRTPSTRLTGWTAAPAVSQVDGGNPRYASLGGPETLDNCGTPAGYGWYRVKVKAADARTRTFALPMIGNRMHMYINGEFHQTLGTGPGAGGYFTDIKFPARGEHTIVGLIDHTGRFSGGNDFGRRKGWFGHMYEVKSMRASRGKLIDAEPVDPFLARNFIIGQSQGRMLSGTQACWTFTHRKKAPLLVQVEGCPVPGMFLLNDEPLAFYAGETGERSIRFLVDPELPIFKRGGNDLRFAPDPGYEDGAQQMIEAVKIYETVENLTETAAWSFARWEPPGSETMVEIGKGELKSLRGKPCWWRTNCEIKETPHAKWFDTSGLSKGVVFLNGEALGRYFTAGRDGKKVGPQTRLYMPQPWLREGENEITVFDEHGFAPTKTKIVYCNEGEFEGE